MLKMLVALCAAALLALAQPAHARPALATASAAGSLLVKPVSGNLWGFSITTGAAAGFVLVLDAAAVPTDGAVTPVKCYQLAASSTLGAQWSATGGGALNFRNGIVIVFSIGDNCFTKTASATAFISAEYD